MRIYRPIQTNRLTQAFGENKACINRQGKVTAKTGIFCPVGYTDFYISIGMIGHNGEDWACWRGEPVYFPVDGEFIIKTEVDKDGGVGVNAISKEQFEGSFIKFKFWHLQSVAVYDGQVVKAGDLIGCGDSTGASSGDHLHWSMKRCSAEGNVINRNNGFYGAIDFRPFFENVFVLDVLAVKAKALTVIQQATKLIYQVKQFISNFYSLR